MKDIAFRNLIIPPLGILLWAISALFLILSFIACIVELVDLSDKYSTNGIILSYTEDTESGRYYPIVRYKDSSHISHTFTDATGSSAPLYSVGTIVQVDYMINNPSASEVTTLYFRWGLTIGLCGCAIMFFVLGYLFSERLI